MASALVVGLLLGRRDPAAGFPPFTREAGVAGAVLLPLLTLASMWVGLRLADEVQRRMIVDAWAASLIVIMLGSVSWLFLILGGVLPTPPGQAVLFTVIGGGGVAVMVAGPWLKWRRS